MEVNIGNCKLHNRPFEGLCKLCEVVVCPSCVLFGSHKKHDIVSFKEGVLYLRRKIDKEMGKGVFKKEYTDSKLLVIKEALLLMEKSKSETIKKIEDVFHGITGVLHQRKNEILNEINQKFDEEKDKIDQAEDNWECKQDISEKLRQFDGESNSGFLIINSKFILEGIRKISEPTDFTELNIYNNFDTNLYIDIKKNENDENIIQQYDIDHICHAFEGYAQLLDPKYHQYQA